MTLGFNIQKIRKLKKLSVKELAAAIGAKEQSIYAWERGDYEPVKENLESLSKALGVPIKLFYEENPTPDQKPADNKEKMENQEDVYRNIVEGNTEYILIPRSVLQEKYRLVAMEQLQKDKESMDKDKAVIDKLLDMNEKLIAELTSLKAKVPEVQRA